ncbi:MAG: regulator [Prevotellaceae bacterium]|nr:regulator [Prevotellaceae bacterium]
MMRRISLALLALTASLAILSPMQASAQQIGTWNVYPSYWNATRNVVAGDIIYSLTDGNLLAYSTGDSEVRTFDCLTQLNGIKVSQIAYSTAAKRLIIAYDDCNIDLMNSAGEMLNLSALRDKSMTSKTLNGLRVEGKMAYLAMSFGVVEVDMQEGVFRNTYMLDQNVQSVTLLNGSIYAATAQGVLRGKLSDNLQDKSKWTTTAGGNFKQLTTMGNEIIARANVNLYTLSPEGRTTLYSSGNFTFMNLTGGTLVWGNSQQINFCQSTGKVTTVKANNAWQDASYANGTFWVSQGEDGLMAYTLKDGQFVPSAGPIQPNCPKNDLAYRISWAGDRLLVAGGTNTVGSDYHPATAMYLEDGKWTNLQEMQAAPEGYTNFRLYNTTNLVQDPDDPAHHFASPYRSGLCEYKDGKFVHLYHSDNSPLTSILPDNKSYYNFVSCSGLTFDQERNLWMLCSQTDTIIRIRKPNGTWKGLYYSEIADASLCDDYLMHSSGLVMMVSRRLDKRGFFCLDYNQTLDNRADDRHMLRRNIVNQDNTSYIPEEFYCLCEDLDGAVWAGTSLGLFVIPDPTTFFDNDFHYEQIKINRNDGSGLADYLLNGVSISCITIDGANRKWVGTHDDGLYLISADGQEMLHHFTTDDSPILSNSIQSLAVHPTTGMVMIATDKGLCSYVADATEGADKMDADDVLVVPNPVTADYTGPIAVRGLARDSEVKILSSSGQLVWSGISAGGTFTWNGCNKQGKRVASGVYHVVANNAAGKNAIVTRIVIIK